MRWRSAWIAVSFFIAFSGIELPEADARIVVGVSTVNVAFCRFMSRKIKVSLRMKDSMFSSSCSMPARRICRR